MIDGTRNYVMERVDGINRPSNHCVVDSVDCAQTW